MKKRKKILIGILVITVLAVSAFFLGRNSLLRAVVNKVRKEFSQRFNAQLSLGSVAFSGLTAVSTGDILISSLSGDTILFIDTVRVHPSVWKFITGSPAFEEIYADGGEINISCSSGTCNFNELIRNKNASRDSIQLEERKNMNEFGQRMNSLYRRVFDFAPQQALLQNIHISFRNDTIQRGYVISRFVSDADSLHGEMTEKANGNRWICTGSFSQSERLLDVSVYPAEKKILLPGIRELMSAAVTFDTIRLRISDHEYAGHIFRLKGEVHGSQLSFYHKRISDDTVRIPSAAFNFSFLADRNSVGIDSSSSGSLTDISFVPFVRYTKNKSSVYELGIRTDTTPSTAFFRSLPEGIFEVVRDIKADGTLQFAMNFRLDDAVPDSVTFSCRMFKDKFRIRDAGSSGLYKMNGEFTHYVYERDRLFRTFTVGPSNDDFTPIENISPNLKNAILTSEDGNFYYHNGFNEEAFRKSIAENYKSGRFVRGGSTITMQLVKNIFLTRKKTVARKAEEALLVWLIESNRIYSKDRMFEVYLNIIELGPNVYGVSEATAFYFDKKPSEVTLAEGIFLSHLLPHPKWVKSSFDSTGALKPYLADYYRNVANFMVKRQLITEEEQAKLEPVIKIKGPAKEFLFPEDTLQKRWWFW